MYSSFLSNTIYFGNSNSNNVTLTAAESSVIHSWDKELQW